MAKGDTTKARVKSVWLTRKETMSVMVNKKLVCREISIGLSAEADKPNARSIDLYEGAHQALNLLMEEEKENYLNVTKAYLAHNKLQKDADDLTQRIVAGETIEITPVQVEDTLPVSEEKKPENSKDDDEIVVVSVTVEEESGEGPMPAEKKTESFTDMMKEKLDEKGSK